MSSDFDKDALNVDRRYSRNWFTQLSSNFLIKHRFKLGYRLAEWLVGYANVLRQASPRDGYEWVDRRTSLFSKYAAEQQAELISAQLSPKKVKEATTTCSRCGKPTDVMHSCSGVHV